MTSYKNGSQQNAESHRSFYTTPQRVAQSAAFATFLVDKNNFSNNFFIKIDLHSLSLKGKVLYLIKK